ncbi:MAG: NUDIX hydrolase, partial [Bacteroidales bacterium]|nr:NUDIX hydrolase [Bacteroidales bacterium]
MYTYKYPRPALTADIALFNLDSTQVMLIRRGNEPFKDCWAFPGGFFDMTDRDIEHTATRELEEETGLKDIALTERFVASREGRDPRGRTVSVIFTA